MASGRQGGGGGGGGGGGVGWGLGGLLLNRQFPLLLTFEHSPDITKENNKIDVICVLTARLNQIHLEELVPKFPGPICFLDTIASPSTYPSWAYLLLANLGQILWGASQNFNICFNAIVEIVAGVPLDIFANGFVGNIYAVTFSENFACIVCLIVAFICLRWVT